MAEVSIHSYILGNTNNPPLVMLHGWGRDADNLLPLGKLLQQYFCVHLLDLPGFGKSTKPEGDHGTEDYAAWVRQYLIDHELSSVHLLGHSFGGRISIRLASSHPNLVRSLTLIGSHGLQLRRPWWQTARFKLIALLGKVCKATDTTLRTKLFKERFAPRFGSRDYLAAGELRGTLVKTVTEDQTANARAIVAPTLLLWGENDTETPVSLAERLHGLIAGSLLMVLPFKGHYPFEDIGSHLCAYYIRDFVLKSESAVHGISQERQVANAE